MRPKLFFLFFSARSKNWVAWTNTQGVGSPPSWDRSEAAPLKNKKAKVEGAACDL